MKWRWNELKSSKKWKIEGGGWEKIEVAKKWLKIFWLLYTWIWQENCSNECGLRLPLPRVGNNDTVSTHLGSRWGFPSQGWAISRAFVVICLVWIFYKFTAILMYNLVKIFWVFFLRFPNSAYLSHWKGLESVDYLCHIFWQNFCNNDVWSSQNILSPFFRISKTCIFGMSLLRKMPS